MFFQPIHLLLLLLSALGSSHADRSGIEGVPEGYQLVWSDEFDVDGKPDTANWQFEHGYVRNEEDQWYQEENAWIANGHLIIEARIEDKPNPGYDPASGDWRASRARIKYTSSSIHTRRKQAWQFGRFEMRGKIDTRSGLWPAWWTLGTQGRWPANGEIDIMEYYRDMLLANVACLGPDGRTEWYDTRLPIDSLGGHNWATVFHIWRMDWDEKCISLYVDDRLLNRVELEKLENKDGSGTHPFRQPHYMLLNFAIGGLNGGPIDDSCFPSRYLVDYARVYQRRDQGKK